MYQIKVKNLPELAPLRRLAEDAWLVQELLWEWQPDAVFSKPVIRLTDFENRCFSGIEQAR